MVSGKLSPGKSPPAPPKKKIVSLWKYPLWIFPLVKITPQNFSPEKIGPWRNYLQWNPLPIYKSCKWKKKQNYRIFYLEESCAIQHPYQNNQGPLWYTGDLTENTGIRYFLYRIKKNSKNRTKVKMVKWHLLASCTIQGELKLGSQIIKLGKYVKLLNSQLSMHWPSDI